MWTDDCVEVWVRSTRDWADYDQFVVDAAGARQRQRSRVSGKLPGALLPAQSRVGADAWIAEMAIPFSQLDIAAPEPGDLLRLSWAGRTTPAPEPCSPPGRRARPTAGLRGTASFYFETNNLLPNPDMSQRADGAVVGWGFSEGMAERFSSVEDRGHRAIRWDAPGLYATASENVQLS